MIEAFKPRISFIFTLMAAAIVLMQVEPWDWWGLLPYWTVWILGIISGLLDAPLLKEAK